MTISDGVTEIGEKAFYWCGLTNVTIPDSVKRIGDFAFSICSDLENVSLPRGVKLGEGVFDDCPKVKITYRTEAK